MKLPERIKVGPYEYAVELVDEVRIDGVDRAGTCDYVQHRIRIRREMPPDRQREVFFHEALHAIDDVLWNGLTEKQITRLSRGLTAFLLDNDLLCEDV
jgi:hypothetical protein